MGCSVDEEIEKNSISKSEAKRRMLALQEVGEALTKLSPETLKKFDLPESLLEALLDAKRINPNKHGGMNRQMQYIGKLMRQVDAAPIIEKLEALKAPSRRETALAHLAEDWRLRMMADPTAAAAFIREFDVQTPHETGKELAVYITKAREEHAKKAPPKHFRLIYKMLLKHIQAKAAADDEATT